MGSSFPARIVALQLRVRYDRYMSMEVFYDPACGSAKALTAVKIAGKGGIGKTALLLNHLLSFDDDSTNNIFLCSHHGDLKEYKATLHGAFQEYDFLNMYWWGDLTGWRKYTRPRLPRETPKISSYGQSFLKYPADEYPACSPDPTKDFGILERAPAGLSCLEESAAESSFPGQILSIYLFLRQAYRLAAFLLARLAVFFQTPVIFVKKAVSERRFFVLNEAHPPDAAAFSSGLLTAF
jgi:hypothetical protein